MNDSGVVSLLPLLLVIALVAVVVIATRRGKLAARARSEAELEAVGKLAYEDITALGEDLQGLDADLAGRDLDAGATADYQRALDGYEDAKTAGEKMTTPEHVGGVTRIIDDARYAIACVRARVAGDALPTRRPPCFFDPRHGTAVTDVSWAPAGGTARDVPACALDAERVRLGADPDVRQVLVGSERVPYWQGGPAYQSYASGYYGMPMMNVMFAGMLLGGMGGFGGGGFDGDAGGYDGGAGDGGGDFGGGFDSGGGGFDGGF